LDHQGENPNDDLQIFQDPFLNHNAKSKKKKTKKRQNSRGRKTTRKERSSNESDSSSTTSVESEGPPKSPSMQAHYKPTSGESKGKATQESPPSSSKSHEDKEKSKLVNLIRTMGLESYDVLATTRS